MQTAISVQAVTKTYATGNVVVPVLHGVDFAAQRGEVVFLMGPSGSGKTTLLSILGCLLQPDAGTIMIQGQAIISSNAKQLAAVRLAHIGFVFQSFNLFAALSAAENVRLALELKGQRGRQARCAAAALLDAMGLQDKHDALPAKLSGGQQQRVAIARALAGNPEIILADEPTAALDGESGGVVLELLHKLAHEQNCAVVIVTHDPRALPFADRVVNIEDGRIQPSEKLR